MLCLFKERQHRQIMDLLRKEGAYGKIYISRFKNGVGFQEDKILDNRMKKRLSGTMAVMLILLAVLMTGCGNALQEKNTEESNLPGIVVGCDIYPPYSYTGSDGQQTGVDIELAREAFRRMGYQPQFVYIDWEMKDELLNEGTIDCVWSSFSMDGREDRYRWAGPYMLSRQVVAVRTDSDIYTLQDLADKSVAVQVTTKPEEIFLGHTDERIPELRNVLSLQNRELIYPSLSKGYVDAVAAHETSVLQYMKDYNVEYRILEEPLLTVGLGVAFQKEDTRGIAEQLNETLREIRLDGTEEQILSQYLENVEGYLEVEEYDK